MSASQSGEDGGFDHQNLSASLPEQCSKQESVRVFMGDSPIDRLPIEIMIQILFLAAVPPYSWDIKDIWTLAQVCKKWWSVILSNAIFWPEISTLMRTRTNMLVLRRNKSLPLSVKIYFSHGASTCRAAGGLITLAREHASRWSSILIKGPDVRRSVLSRAFEDLAAPNLISVALQLLGRQSDLPVETVCLPDCPNLQHLRLQRVFLVTSHIECTKLGSLQLHDINGDALTTESLWAIISSCSGSLVWLRISVVTDKGTPRQFEGLKTRFPLLRTLIIQTVPHRLHLLALHHIDAPSVTFASFNNLNAYDFISSISSISPGLIRTAMEAVSNIHVKFALDLSTMSITSPEYEGVRMLRDDELLPKHSLEIDLDQVKGNWSDLREFFASWPKPFAVTLYPGERVMFFTHVQRLLRPLHTWKNATRLTLESGYNTSLFLGLAAEPHLAGNGGAGQWIFPQLRELIVMTTDRSVADEVATLVRKRRDPEGCDVDRLHLCPIQRVYVKDELRQALARVPFPEGTELLPLNLTSW